MSSQLDTPQPQDEEINVEALSFQELLRDAQEGSISHLLQMVDKIRPEYPAHAQAILNVITANLAIPQDMHGAEATNEQMSVAIISLELLIEVIKSYLTGANPPIGPAILVSHALAERYLFWIHYLIGIHTSSPSSEPSINPSIRSHLLFYSRLVYFLHALFEIPSITHESFSAALRPKLLEASTALWVVLVDGQPPIYPQGRPQEPHINAVDLMHRLFSNLTYVEHEAIAEIIMEGRICTPRVFAQRTIGRIRALENLRALSHLTDLPSITIEISNMINVLTITGELMFVDHRLEPTFIEEGAIGVYVEIYASVAERMEIAVRDGAEGWGAPERKVNAGNYIWGWLHGVIYLLSVITSMSTVSVLKQMEESMSRGALRLLSISEILPPQESARGDHPWTILDFASMAASHLEVFPAVYKDVMKYIAPRVPDLLTAVRGDPGYPLDPQLPSAFDINMMKIMAGFLDKEKRVRLCDNLKHHDRVDTSSCMTWTSQAEHACSRCHSVAYCSVQCQQADWAALHKAECKHMAKDYAEREGTGNIYSYHNRAFQTSFIRHAYDSHVPAFDAQPPDPLISTDSYGRHAVTIIDCPRLWNSLLIPIEIFNDCELPRVAAHLRPRFSTFIKTFTEGNGDYEGSDRERVRAQNYRLVARPFVFGREDVNLLILMRRVNFTHIPMGSTFPHLVRGAEAKSDFVVHGAFAYMSKARKWTKKRTSPPMAGLDHGLVATAASLSEWIAS